MAAEAGAEAGFAQRGRGPGAGSKHGNCCEFYPFGGVPLYRCDSVPVRGRGPAAYPSVERQPGGGSDRRGCS